jgi:hypothetical protein
MSYAPRIDHAVRRRFLPSACHLDGLTARQAGDLPEHIDPRLPPLNGLAEFLLKRSQQQPVKHGIYGLAKRKFADWRASD